MALAVVKLGLRCPFSAQSYIRPTLASLPLWAPSDLLLCVCNTQILHSIDASTVTVFLSQNSKTFECFVELMFDDCKRELQGLRNENN